MDGPGWATRTVKSLTGKDPPIGRCSEILFVSDPQVEHTSNQGLTRHAYSDVVMSSILNDINASLADNCPVFISAHILVRDEGDHVADVFPLVRRWLSRTSNIMIIPFPGVPHFPSVSVFFAEIGRAHV